MVGAGKDPLDHAHHWHGYLRIWDDDHVVSPSPVLLPREPLFTHASPSSSLPIQLYLVDTFTFAASALAAASVFRSMLGFAFPLFGSQMFAALGVGGGNSLLAGLAIALGIPFPVWLWFYGESMRAKSSLAR